MIARTGSQRGRVVDRHVELVEQRVDLLMGIDQEIVVPNMQGARWIEVLGVGEIGIVCHGRTAGDQPGHQSRAAGGGQEECAAMCAPMLVGSAVT